MFVVSAFIILGLLYQVGRNSNWEPSASLPHRAKGTENKETNIRPPTYQRPPEKAKPDEYRGATPDEPQRQPYTPKKESNIEIPILKEENSYKDYALPAVTSVKTSKAAVKDMAAGGKTAGTSTKTSVATKVTKASGSATNKSTDDEDKDRGTTSSKKTSMTKPTAVHWEKQTEFFPVPTESLIKLPTGKPLPIARIQAPFSQPESAPAKEKRERRLASVKAEAGRAWKGYKDHAWTHDEVQPVSKTARDPFAGWAATLVDALDTLWIMGMRDEFDDAVRAVAEIDFTTTPHRNDIPVFETIIRYLGGLLAAYDVSGGRGGGYGVLLDKALELAEILMGVFDTPNRMPVLYYNWRPEYASQPHRAGTGSSVAELGSMSMEFTRLAQVTGQYRFYDAVARITDAFEEWQNRGTALDGIFPQNVDASGCNRTALNARNAETASEAAKELARLEALEEEEEEAVGYAPADLSAEGEGGAKNASASGSTKSELKPARQTSGGSTMPAFDSPNITLEKARSAAAAASKRRRGVRRTSNTIPAAVGRGMRSPPYKANGLTADWDCPAQGLVSGGYGADSYSMGGSQDSAYEYFPKQYLLLGGLVPKYRTMHEKTVKAVKKHLLYRPMIKDESRDLLFSARANVYEGTVKKDITLDYEVTHLTCFLGGMFGLGGKIFGSEEDVEIGKKLADGCAWAYEIMPTGIMPETAMMMPCKSVEKCPWNETAWYEKIDPNAQWRAEQMADYLERMKVWEEEVRNITEQAALNKQAAETELAAPKTTGEATSRAAEEDSTLRPVNDTLPGTDGPTNLKVGASSGDSTSDLRTAQNKVGALRKRSAEDASDSILDRNRKTMEDNEVAKKVGEELDFNSPSSHTTGHHDYEADATRQTPLFDIEDEADEADEELDLPSKPYKPQTHEEYVADRLSKEHLPPGFVSLNDKRYILRYVSFLLPFPSLVHPVLHPTDTL